MAPSSTPLARLADAGVAIWLDDLSRERLRTGNLAELVADKGVVGVTTNPSIFAERAVEGRRLRRAAARARRGRRRRRRRRSSASPRTTSGRRPTSCAPSTTPPTAWTAASRSRSTRGWPRTPTARSPRRSRCGRRSTGRTSSSRSPPPVEGLPAITAVLAEGISVNVTLIFSLERYGAVLDAFQSGLEQAQANGHDLAPIASVASFFVSRVDTAIDPRLDAIGTPEAAALRGKAAIANARLAYGALPGGRRRRPLDGAGRRRRAPAAAAVGVDGRQGQGVPGHAVRRRAGRGRRRQHDARGHARTRSRTTAATAATRSPGRGRRRQAVIDRLCAAWASTSTRSPSSWRSRAWTKFTASWGELLGTVSDGLAGAAEQNAAGDAR